MLPLAQPPGLRGRQIAVGGERPPAWQTDLPAVGVTRKNNLGPVGDERIEYSSIWRVGHTNRRDGISSGSTASLSRFPQVVHDARKLGEGILAVVGIAHSHKVQRLSLDLRRVAALSISFHPRVA